MSASYIHRDPLVLSPTPLQILSSKNGTLSCPNDNFMVSSGRSYLDRPVSSSSPSSVSKSSPSTTNTNTQSQVSLQSPKMSPDSTLTHYHHPPCTTNTLTAGTTSSSTTPMSRFSSNTSPGSSGLGQCASSCASSSSSSIGDGFLRSALTSNVSTENSSNTNSASLKLNSAISLNDSHVVGSSTGNGFPGLGLPPSSVTAKLEPNPAAMMAAAAMMMRPRSMTAQSTNLSHSSMTPTKPMSAAVSTGPASTPTPSSTTPVKKSSRRNPWGSETYSDLISIAIHSYPDHQATLQQIYDFIISNYEYFRERSDPTSSAGWKNSIRHNLSLHDRFTKCPKSSDNTKSSYWRINTEVASKPYVRRRACSMDTNNSNSLKRSGGNHCGKASNRAGGGGAHRGGTGAQHTVGDKLATDTGLGSRLGSLMPPLNEVHGPILTPLMTPSDMMQSSRSDLNQQSNGPRQNSARSAFTKTYLGSNKLPSYFAYPPNHNAGSLGQNKSGQSDLGSTQNGMPGRWATPKPTAQTAFRTSAYSSHPASSYMYDQGSTGLSLEPTDFTSILGSTDQASVRSRASGLIEQLLCSDHPMGAMLSNGRSNAPQNSVPATYLPNSSFMSSNPMASSMSLACGPTPMAIDTGPSFTHDHSLMPHSSAVDLRPHTGSVLSEGSADNRAALAHQHHSLQQQQQHHHHLRPVPMHGCTSNADMMNSSAFATSWSPYMSQFPVPSSIGHSSAMGVHNMNYSVFNGNGSFHSQPDASQPLSETKVKYDSIETMASSNHNNHHQQQQQQHPQHSSSSQSQRNPFLSSSPQMTPVSSSAGTPICSSTATTWRHALGLDVPQHTDPNRISGGPLTPLAPAASPSSTQSTATVSHETRSLGGPPLTPPNPLYYSPMRQTLSNMYGGSDCALDTPPYHHQQQQAPQTQNSPSLKSEQLEMMDSAGSLVAAAAAAAAAAAVASASSAVSSVGTTDYDTSSQTSSTATRHSAYTASYCSGGVGGGLRAPRSDPDADSEMSTRFADSYSYDDDCEPLELELSLELADRIVGSTRSDAKP